MGRSFKISEKKLEEVNDTFNRTGWTHEYLAGSAKCVRQTVSKFLKGGYVDKHLFEALCHELGLKLAEIADFELEEEILNTSVSINGNREQSLANLPQKPTETNEKKVSFSILGTASKVDLPKLKALVAHLQKITGDTSIEIVDIEKGSIKLILEGSQESLEQIEALFKCGQLTEVEGIQVEDVQFVTHKVPQHDKDIQAIDKKRLAFTLAGSVSSEEIQELKTAFTKTLDNDEEIEAGNKARLVQEIITKGANGRSLIGADLIGADLSGAYLIGADLSGANLISANLSGAYLSSANLSSANLSGANLSSANLISANLIGAYLIGANLRRANLSGAKLIGAYLIGADLSGAYLIGADLSGADLSGAKLSGAKLSGADLIGANLIGANLIGADLICAYLSSANLSDANLSDANLSDANLSEADLSNAKVENTQFGNNSGISEEMKKDLIERGASFEESPGDRSGIPVY